MISDAPIQPELATVELDGPVRYVTWQGPSTNPIVCLHGFGESHAVWCHAAHTLRELGSVFAPDLPGFGRTPRCGRATTLDRAADVVLEFLDRMVSGPAVLVGSSFSGAVAARIAGTHPEFARAVVLSSSYAPPRFDARFALDLANMAGVTALTIARGLLDGHHASSPGSKRESTDRPDDAALAQQAWEMVRSLGGLSMHPVQSHALFDRVRVPTLVLHGRNDSRVPLRWVEALVARHPQWQLEVFESSHVVHVEEPDRWTRCVAQWIETHVGS
jgi:pimeloyl-ACP methyl ester carboxylesterase